MTEPTKLSVQIPVHGDLLADALDLQAAINPTPTQQAEQALRRAQMETDLRATFDRVSGWHRHALACSPELAAVVLDLHGPELDVPFIDCAGCDADYPEWPCRTYRAVVPWIEYPEVQG